jgi:hypothetical protein
MIYTALYLLYGCKQLSNQQETAFLVSAQGGFAARLGDYLARVNTDINKLTGRVWWTGTKGHMMLPPASTWPSPRNANYTLPQSTYLY